MNDIKMEYMEYTNMYKCVDEEEDEAAKKNRNNKIRDERNR